jgi:LuxR family maltose regulon positive regulatory protein
VALIHTKLNRPLVPSGFIRRQRLDVLLAQCLDKPLTVISASAGYGKSSLLSSHMERCDHPNAWISLDENDNDLVLFLSYFLKAVLSMFPEAVEETFRQVSSPKMPTLSKLTTSLVNELSQIEQPFILVLDDYHRIHEQPVHDLITGLLRYPPPSLHLVIISRDEPPLSLATFRVKGSLCEVATRDLCFTAAETERFLSKALHQEIAPSSIEAWQEKTEGWIAGLQLVTLGLNQQIATQSLPVGLLKDVSYVMEYFHNEIFSAQPEQVQRYLLFTAILDRFNAPLCEALSRSDDRTKPESLNGEKFISWLIEKNLFLIPLDAEKGWYRFHHLLSNMLIDLLEKRYDRKQVVHLHVQASRWFAENDLAEEALQHALAAEDIERAVELVVRNGFQLMDNQEWPQLKRWLRMLPYEEVEKSPELLIFDAWHFHLQHNLADMDLCLQKAEELMAALSPEASTRFMLIQGYCDALRAFHFYMKADGEQALAHAQRACTNIPVHHKRGRVFAHIFQLGARQMLGELDAGLTVYQEAMKDRALLPRGYQSVFMANLCFVYWMDADLISLRQTAERSLLNEHIKRLPETTSMGLYHLGIASYYLNDLALSEEHLTTLINEYPTYNEELFAYSSFALALIYQAKGKPGKARKCCETVVAQAIDSNNVIMLQEAKSFVAELALRQDRLAEASHWLKHFRGVQLLPVYMSYMPQLTQVKILLAQNTTSSRLQAVDLLDELHAFLNSINNKVFLIDVLALQALSLNDQGDHDGASEKLDQAIALAEPSGCTRPFLDLGAPMRELFVQQQQQGRHQGYAEKILTDFGGQDSLEQSTPYLSLTNREIDILKLVAQRLRDKEIADKISVSPDTVKAHMRNIRKKLKVNSREDAYLKAAELNLLP